ncbi:MAG: hypothetical protein KY447_12660, partial [Actinobacteria bacterium]|nr:hypothetical protein [Actinomycetota bacterium]
GAAFARVWTLDAAPGVLELQASAGMYRHLDGEHSHVPVGEFKIGWIAEELAPHLTNDVLHDPRISDHDWARREGMVASPATRCWPATSWSACWPCSPATSSPSDVVVAAQEKLAGANEAEIDAEFRKWEQQHETRQIVEEVAQAKADAERRVTDAQAAEAEVTQADRPGRGAIEGRPRAGLHRRGDSGAGLVRRHGRQRARLSDR